MDLVKLLFFGDRVQFIVVAEVLELVVPAVGDLSDLDLGELVLFVIGIVLVIVLLGRVFSLFGLLGVLVDNLGYAFAGLVLG